MRRGPSRETLGGFLSDVQSRQGQPAGLSQALSADLDNLLHQINPGDAERAHPRVDIGVDASGALPKGELRQRP